MNNNGTLCDNLMMNAGRFTSCVLEYIIANAFQKHDL